MHISRSHKGEDASPATGAIFLEAPLIPSSTPLIETSTVVLETTIPQSADGDVASAFDLTSIYQTTEAAPSPAKRQRIEGDYTPRRSGSGSREKRPARLRHITAPIRDRIETSLQQRMYMIQRTDNATMDSTFTVCSTPDDVHDVHMCVIPTCTCVEFAKGDVCKHQLFTFIRVLKVPSDDNVIAQRGFLTSELTDLFTNSPPEPTAQPQAAEFTEDSPPVQRTPVDPECPICYEIMEDNAERLVWCQNSCGHSIHKRCYDTTASFRISKQQEPICAWCKKPSVFVPVLDIIPTTAFHLGQAADPLVDTAIVDPSLYSEAPPEQWQTLGTAE